MLCIFLASLQLVASVKEDAIGARSPEGSFSMTNGVCSLDICGFTALNTLVRSFCFNHALQLFRIHLPQTAAAAVEGYFPSIPPAPSAASVLSSSHGAAKRSQFEIESENAAQKMGRTPTGCQRRLPLAGPCHHCYEH
jgi:hypothetical protein